MISVNFRLPSVRLLLLAGMTTLSTLSATTLYQNNLPTSNIDKLGTDGVRADVGVPETSIANASNTVEPFIEGDQFVVSGETTVTSVTMYEISNATVAGGNLVLSNPANEFSSISLYLGPDVEPLTLASSSYTAVRVLNTDSSNYESIYDTTKYYIWQITFSGLNVILPSAGTYDFAIGAVPNGNNTFAPLESDFADQGSAGGFDQPNQGYLVLFPDGPGGTWVAEEQYAAGSVSGFTNPDNIDVVGTVNGVASPEPSSFALIVLGLAGVSLGLRRRGHRS
jgi:hypothetical protein